MKDVHVIVLAGGGGTRLWPLSRVKEPKFLLDIGRGEPLLADALRRALLLTEPNRVHIVTGHAYADQVREIAHGFAISDLILEPSAKDTATAATLGTAAVARIDPEALIVSLPADQIVGDADETWTGALNRAIHASESDALVCLGVAPTTSKTGFGYAHAPSSEGRFNVRSVLSFHEKPGSAVAEKYLKSGEYFWNTAIMVWHVKTFEELVRAYAPHLASIFSVSASEQDVWEGLSRGALEPVLLEPAAAAGHLLLVPAGLAWSDVGSWATVAETVGDSRSAAVVIHDSERCHVLAKGERRYVLLGVKDLVVVDAGDVVLIVDRGADQQVKELVNGVVKECWPDLI